jgi:hypothetical protein
VKLMTTRWRGKANATSNHRSKPSVPHPCSSTARLRNQPGACNSNNQ